jgi:hypothetical protein
MPARVSAYDAGRAIERPDGGGGFYPAVRTRGFRPFRGAMSVSTLGLRDESKRLTVGRRFYRPKDTGARRASVLHGWGGIT